MVQLESLVSSGQDMLRRQVKRFMDQMEQLDMSDRDIERLISDNKALTEEINFIRLSSKTLDTSVVSDVYKR